MSLHLSPDTQYSLQKRLLLAFGLLLLLFLGLTAYVIDRAYQQSVMTGVQQRLQLQVYALIGVAEPERDGFFVPSLEEARFSQVNSGLYGYIFDSSGNEVWQSPSAVDVSLDGDAIVDVQLLIGETSYGSLLGEDGTAMAYASYGTFWESVGSEYRFVVMESLALSQAEIREFQSNLWVGLAILVVILSLIQYGLLSWGMNPLKRMAGDVASIESGEKEQLGENYPAELKAVSENLNILIRSERQRQKRYRSTLGDLAHSLKTPLAVISGMIQQHKADLARLPENDIKLVEEQLERMNQIISYQLRRAVKSMDETVLGTVTEITPMTGKLLSALNKVYIDKQVQCETSIQDKVFFPGEESDFMELMGLLLDNAFKYCNLKVSLNIRKVDDQLVILVDDDGQGVAESDRGRILERGARADSLKTGQGIGLAVAAEVVSSYKGQMEVSESSLGGARFKITFPINQ